MHSRKLAVLVVLLVAAPLSAEEPTSKLLPEFIVQEYSVSMIAFSPDGNLLAVAGGQIEKWCPKQPATAGLTVWDLKARKKVMTFVGHKDKVISIHPATCRRPRPRWRP